MLLLKLLSNSTGRIEATHTTPKKGYVDELKFKLAPRTDVGYGCWVFVSIFHINHLVFNGTHHRFNPVHNKNGMLCNNVDPSVCNTSSCLNKVVSREAESNVMRPYIGNEKLYNKTDEREPKNQYENVMFLFIIYLLKYLK